MEGRGQHADDRVGLALDVQRAAEDPRVGIEPPVPEGLADDDDAFALRLILLGQEVTPQRGLHAECR